MFECPPSSAGSTRGAVVTRCVALILGVTVSGAAVSIQSTAASTSLAYLHETFGVSERDMAAVVSGKAVVTMLPTRDDREIATLGAIRLSVPGEFYADRLRHIADFKRSPAVPQIGAFGTPASAQDAEELTLDPSDLRHLRKCRERSCGIQLSDAAIRSFQRDVRWSHADAAADANRVMRRMLATLVNDYRSAGDDGLPPYVDARRSVFPGREFQALISSPPAILARFPRLREHVARFPAEANPSVDDQFYWSKEKLGPATVVSVTHLSISHRDDHGPIRFVAVSRQLYASHYFDSSVGITLLLHDGSLPPSAALLVYINRSRLDVLGGVFGGVKRTMVRSRTQATATASLLDARSKVETAFRARARTEPKLTRS